MQKQKIAYIVNPISGIASKKAIIEYVEQATNTQDVDLHIHYTTAAGNATEMAKTFASNGFDRVVAIGGDGTINEVAQGLVHTNTAMGVIPTGSGNGLARHLKIPMQYQQAVDIINTGKIIKIDYGLFNNKLFLCTAGVGFDAHIGTQFAGAGKRGFSTYAQLSVKEYFKYKPQNYKINIEGRTFMRKALLITIANASQWGNNVYIAPRADISDGFLDMVVFTPVPLFDAPIVGVRMFTKQIDKSRYVEVYRIKKAQIDRETDGCVHFDGEPDFMGKHLDISIIHKGLNVVVQ